MGGIHSRTAALRYLFGLTGDIAELDGWPASLARQPRLGPLFELTKPDGLPDAARTISHAIIDEGDEWSSRATPAAARLVRIVVDEVEPRSALIIRSDGPGAVGWPDGRPAGRFEGGTSGPIRYCVGEACTCGETVRLARGDVLTPTIAYAGTSRTTILRVAITTCYGTPEEAIEAWLVDAGVDLSAFSYMGTCPVFGECVDAAATTLYSQLHPGRPAPTVYQIGVGGDFHPLWDLRLEQADDGSGWQVTGSCDHYSHSEACFERLGQE